MREHTVGRIVVGVDGSAHSKAALAWALEEARLRHAEVKVIHAWHVPNTVYEGFAVGAPTVADDEFEAAAREVVKRVVSEVAGPEGAANLSASVVCGHAAEVLLTEAKGADLLVVGSRGLGGFAGMLLGSVSYHVVRHATCPVVITHAPPD